MDKIKKSTKVKQTPFFYHNNVMWETYPPMVNQIQLDWECQVKKGKNIN